MDDNIVDWHDRLVGNAWESYAKELQARIVELEAENERHEEHIELLERLARDLVWLINWHCTEDGLYVDILPVDIMEAKSKLEYEL